MKIIATFLNSPIVVKMPCTGVIKRQPNLGTVINHHADIVIREQDNNSNNVRILKNENTEKIEYQTKVFEEEQKKISREFRFRTDFIDNYRKSFNVLSLNPTYDSTEYNLFKNDNDKINQLKETLSNLLWDEGIATLSDEIPLEPYPILENRIKKIINKEKLKLCSKLFSLTENDIERISCEALALKIRDIENVPYNNGLISYQVSNPSALFQKLNINDIKLYQEHNVTDTFENFETRYLEFNKLASDYWESIATKKLYIQKDYDCLREWKIIKDPFIIDLLDEDILTPITKLQLAVVDLDSIKKKYDIATLIILKIAQISFSSDVLPFFDPIDGPIAEQKSRWFAECAIEEINNETALGLGVEYIDSYATTQTKIKELFIRFFLIDITSAEWVQIASEEDRKNFVKYYIAPEAVKLFISNNLIFESKYLYGGTKIALNYFNYTYKSEALLLEEINIGFRDYSIYQKAINKSYENPFLIDNLIEEISRPINLEDILLIRRSFGQTKTNKDWLEKVYIKNQISALEKLKEYNFVLQNISQIKILSQFYNSIVQKLNSADLTKGNIYFPPDTRIIACYSFNNELVEENTPVIAIKKRFSKQFKSFINIDNELLEKIFPNSIWKVATFIDMTLPDGLLSFCHISKVEPFDKEHLFIEGDFFIGIESNLFPIKNLSKVIPLSSRFLDCNILPFVTIEFLDEVESAINKLNSNIEIQFLNSAL